MESCKARIRRSFSSVDKVMNGQAAPRDVGRLRPAGHRLDKVAMVKLDLEGHVPEIVRCELERRLGKIDPVIVTNLGAGQHPHLARVATGNVEKGEGPIEAPVERVVKQRANGGMRKLVAVDQLLVGRPLSLGTVPARPHRRRRRLAEIDG